VTTKDDPGAGAPGSPGAGAVDVLRRAAVRFVRSYHRLVVEVDEPPPDSAALVVGNHGFGTVTDLNVLALLATLDGLAEERPVSFLVHELAWRLRVGQLLERSGARRASPEAALTALSEGKRVVVFPGGDKDSGKDWWHRNQVSFHGRSGFARLAMESGVPVVPVGVPDVVVPVVELSGAAAVHGVAGVQAVLHGVPACRGLPTGSDGRALDRDVPSERPSGGVEEPTEDGGCESAVLCDPVGTKNQAPAAATTTAATTPSFRSGRRRRLCRAPNFRACRPRRNCLTRKPFTPRPRGSLPNSYASIEAHVVC